MSVVRVLKGGRIEYGTLDELHEFTIQSPFVLALGQGWLKIKERGKTEIDFDRIGYLKA